MVRSIGALPATGLCALSLRSDPGHAENMAAPCDSDRVALTVRTVVVGVDGSAESMSALGWASRVTEGDGTVHAVSATSTKSVDRVARSLESDWTATARERGREPVCHVVDDDPAESLLRTADEVDADLIVVGVHAKPQHAPRTIGRVTAKLIHLANRPLAIVEDGGDHPFGEGTTVVADAGHGVASHRAVHWAAGFAETHGTGLSLIRSTPYRPAFGPDGLLDVLAFYIDPGMLRRWAAEDLAELTDDIQQSTERELPITWSSRAGATGRQLIDAGVDATLIVVGRNTTTGRGHPIPTDLRHIIVHAPCPVIVVPPPHPDG